MYEKKAVTKIMKDVLAPVPTGSVHSTALSPQDVTVQVALLTVTVPWAVLNCEPVMVTVVPPSELAVDGLMFVMIGTAWQVRHRLCAVHHGGRRYCAYHRTLYPS